MEGKLNTKDFFLALSRLVDMAHTSLGEHQNRVAYITWQLGEVMNLNKQELNNLILASLIHDIGALSIEDIKEGKVFEERKKHAIRGWYIINKLDGYEEVADAVKYHHHTYRKLGDENLLAQTIKVADTIDHYLDRDRSALMQKHSIVEYIQGRSGNEFHPRVVEAFASLSQKAAFWFGLEDNNLKHYLQYSPLENRSIEGDEIYNYSIFLRDVLDFRSSYTVKHSTSVMICARVVGEELGLEVASLKELTLAAMLHDIGKLVIPNRILLKNSELDLEEVNTVKKHAYYTYIFLKDANYSENICKWASYHHETYSGKGYPFALIKGEIPYEARIVTFCDLLVALTEDRPYRKGMEINRALEILHSHTSDKEEEYIVECIEKNYVKIKSLILDEFMLIGHEYREMLEL